MNGSNTLVPNGTSENSFLLCDSDCMHMYFMYVFIDRNGEVDWNTLGNILTAHLLGEVRIIV